MELETRRLILRPWSETDAEDLYGYARNPAVGPIAGWPVHTDVEESRATIRNVLSVPETYAVCLRENRRAIGSIGLLIGERSNLSLPATEGEIGYWIGVPFWGQGLIPEACAELIRHAFEDLHLTTLWCGYFDGNEKSKHAQTKCHFRYHHTNRDIHWALMNDTRTEHVTRLTRQEWDALGSNTSADTDAKNLVKFFFTEGYVRKNYDAVLHVLSGTYLDHSPAGAQSSAAAVDILKIVAGIFHVQNLEFLDVFSENGMVATRIRYDVIHTGTCMGIPATGKHIAFEALENFRVKDGLIVESWGYWPDNKILALLQG